MARIDVLDTYYWAKDSECWSFGCGLYLIQQFRSGPVKIGVAGHPVRRLTALQIGNPRRLILQRVYVGTRADCLAIEFKAIENFKSDLIRGEWLRAPLKQLIEFIERGSHG